MIKALALTGPTASGKTALSLAVAEKLGAEIISCDSMQIYLGMDIGTAKATAEERATIPHHMIDFLSPARSYSAEDYRHDAMRCARDITDRGRLPLFVGGTGLYIDTLMRGAVESPPSDPAVRARLTEEASREGGAELLWERLMAVDPESAGKTHANNVRRVIRALEIYEITGRPKSYFDSLSHAAPSDISVGMITLDFHNRDNLYRRVDERVEVMIRLGLVDEVRGLYEGGMLSPEFTSAQAIGYKEIISYLKGECSLDEACELIKLSSRRYAKRQLTWFRHESDAVKLYVDSEDGVMKSRNTLVGEALEAVSLLAARMNIGE